MRQHKRHRVQYLYGKVIFWPLFLLAVTLLVLVSPAHAADDNTVSIAVDQNATLKPSGNLYKATTNVTVKTGKPYGFNLTMQASTADLINTIDSNHKISAISSTTPVALDTNQWGYSLKRYDTTFSAVPTATDTPAVLVDTAAQRSKVGSRIARCKGKTNCKARVTFGANVNPSKLASGKYSTTVVYTAIVKPKPAPIPMAKLEPAHIVAFTICRSGNLYNDCQVDLDANMIPVKYTGSTTNAQWTSLAKPEDAAHQGEWYNYDDKQWANAITVKKEALAKYKGQTRAVDQSDILGHWVYIPRYAYEVMRRDGTDKTVPAQNFLIHFEKRTDAKRHPATCPDKGKDYRTECGLNRNYIRGQPSSQGTWATHPAFTFGAKELNGIWFAKFETTGTTSQPTVLPNEAHISGEYSGMDEKIGNFYSLSKTLGINDPNNVGGSGFTTTQDNHHLAKLSSHMANNNDWGAVTYLSASKYGAGYNKVQINSSAVKHTTYGDTYSITGCGPWEDGYIFSYGNSNDYWIIGHNGISVGSLGDQQACGTDNPQRAYNGTLGQLASTTNNVYGVYDMYGGGHEYVAASYSGDPNYSNTGNFGAKAQPPYVNNYNFTSPNSCTFATCGGQDLYETNNGTNNSSTDQKNDNNYMYFVTSSHPWFERGGSYNSGSSGNGLFSAGGNSGYAGFANSFRVALAPAPHD